MQQIEISLYKFNELPGHIQNTVLDRERGRLVEDSDWANDIIEKWKARLESWGFCNPDIFHSGFSCQGDGACFTCDYIDFEKYTDHLILQAETYEQAKWLRVFALLFDKGLLNAKVYNSDWRYCHENSISLEYEILRQPDDFYKRFDDKLGDEIERCMVDISKTIYRELEALNKILTDDEMIAEDLTSSEMKFLEDGRVWRLN